MRGLKTITLITLLSGVAMVSHAQDLHFTQFDQNYLYANPAMIGKFNGLAKYNATYRTQWSSVSIPYESYSAAAESSSLFGRNTFGGGISFFQQQAGDGEFTVSKFNIGLSYSVKLNNNSALSLGFLGGVHNYSLDFNKLKFNQQYVEDIGFNPSLPSGESPRVENFIVPSLASGLSFHGKYNWGALNTGLGLFNILNSSALTFYSLDPNRQDFRYTFHFNAEIKAGLNYIIPVVYIGQHQSLDEALVGMKYRATIGNNENALDFGVVNRFNDAIGIIVGAKLADFYVGYSFDANTSDLQQSSNGRGASEISISYIYNPVKSFKRQFDSCPVFL